MTVYTYTKESKRAPKGCTEVVFDDSVTVMLEDVASEAIAGVLLEEVSAQQSTAQLEESAVQDSDQAYDHLDCLPSVSEKLDLEAVDQTPPEDFPPIASETVAASPGDLVEASLLWGRCERGERGM